MIEQLNTSNLQKVTAELSVGLNRLQALMQIGETRMAQVVSVVAQPVRDPRPPASTQQATNPQPASNSPRTETNVNATENRASTSPQSQNAATAYRIRVQVQGQTFELVSSRPVTNGAQIQLTRTSDSGITIQTQAAPTSQTGSASAPQPLTTSTNAASVNNPASANQGNLPPNTAVQVGSITPPSTSAPATPPPPTTSTAGQSGGQAVSASDSGTAPKSGDAAAIKAAQFQRLAELLPRINEPVLARVIDSRAVSNGTLPAPTQPSLRAPTYGDPRIQQAAGRTGAIPAPQVLAQTATMSPVTTPATPGTTPPSASTATGPSGTTATGSAPAAAGTAAQPAGQTVSQQAANLNTLGNANQSPIPSAQRNTAPTPGGSTPVTSQNMAARGAATGSQPTPPQTAPSPAPTAPPTAAGGSTQVSQPPPPAPSATGPATSTPTAAHATVTPSQTSAAAHAGQQANTQTVTARSAPAATQAAPPAASATGPAASTPAAAAHAGQQANTQTVTARSAPTAIQAAPPAASATGPAASTPAAAATSATVMPSQTNTATNAGQPAPTKAPTTSTTTAQTPAAPSTTGPASSPATATTQNSGAVTAPSATPAGPGSPATIADTRGLASVGQTTTASTTSSLAGPHRVTLNIGGQLMEVVAPKPIPVGTEVKATRMADGQISVQLPPPRAMAVAEALRQHLPRQQPPDELFNQLSQLSGNRALQQAKPLLMSLISLLLGRSITNPGKADSEEVKRQLMNGGTLMEGKLAKGDTQSLLQDQKAILLKLAQQLQQGRSQELPANVSERLAQLTQQAVSRVITNQIHSLGTAQAADDGGETSRALVVDIPVQNQQGQHENVSLRISQQPSAKREEENTVRRWQVEMGFRIKGLPPMSATLTLEGDHVDLVWQGAAGTRHILQPRLSELRGRLEQLGLTVDVLGIKEGAISPSSTPERRGLIDVET